MVKDGKRSNLPKGGVMKKQLQKRTIVGLVMLALLAVLAPAAQSCLVEDEPGRGLHKHWDSTKHEIYWDAGQPDFRLQSSFRTAHWNDEDGWRNPGRFYDFGKLSSMFWEMPSLRFSGWTPFGLYGAKWADIFKDWDLEKLMNRMEDSPAFVLFGGFMRPMFVALVFPLGDGNGGGPIEPPPNGTPTPVPAAALLLATGLAGLGVLRLKQRRARG
jgi:hypothetical protein